MKTSPDGPITLGLPLRRPTPFPGCGVCAALVRQRGAAAGQGDWSRVTDCDVEIRNHEVSHAESRQ